jgi:hypothetical protein
VKKLDDGVAIAALSVAMVEVIRAYRETAPTLADIRRAAPEDFETRQLILDADMMGLIICVAIGGAGAVLTRHWYPLALTLLALGMISGYYRSVLRSPNGGMEDARAIANRLGNY